MIANHHNNHKQRYDLRSIDGWIIRSMSNGSFAACSMIIEALAARSSMIDHRGVIDGTGAIGSRSAIDQRNATNAMLVIMHRDVINSRVVINQGCDQSSGCDRLSIDQGV